MSECLKWYNNMGWKLVNSGMKQNWVEKIILDYQQSGEDHYTPRQILRMSVENLFWTDTSPVPDDVIAVFSNEAITTLKKLALDKSVPLADTPWIFIQNILE